VTFDGDLVLAPGFQMIYFELMGKWFGVGKVRNLRGKHTGYYCDIVTPPRLIEDGGVELTDLFLDLWVSPDLRYEVLDEDELEDALSKGLITKGLYEKAKKELRKLVAIVEQGKFPPRNVKDLMKKLNL
jgi:predicted RNA-binding protein associated with RNAse of E/G family